MIDLSFLTEEEQEAILSVLQRDAELKKAEEQRVRNLQRTVSDQGQLRYMTGEWFYETKQLRHQDRIHGTDIIRASMRHTHKPLTILELSQILPERSRFLSSEHEEVFVPPVLRGLLQEPLKQLNNETYPQQSSDETPQDPPAPPLQSPTKQRKNPFNSEVVVTDATQEEDRKLWDGAVDQAQTNAEGPLASPDSCISFASDFQQDPKDCSFTHNAPVPMPMPNSRPFSTSSQDCFAEVDKPGGRLTNYVALHGILKHLSTASSADSLSSHLDLHSPGDLHCPPETWMDRKQVRFSSMAGQSRTGWQDGRAAGEHSLLEVDSVPPSEAERRGNFWDAVSTTVSTDRPLISPPDSLEGDLRHKSEACPQEPNAGRQRFFHDVSEQDLSPEIPGVSAEESGKSVHPETEPEEEGHSKAADRPPGHRLHQLPERSADISTVDTRPSSNGSSKGSSHAVSPKPRQKLLAFFRGGKDKSAGQCPEEREEKQKEPGNNLDLTRGAADATTHRPACVRQEARQFETMQAGTLQLSGPQNVPFKELMTSLDAATHEAADGGVAPQRSSSTKAFWERDNSGPTILFTSEEESNETGPEASHDPPTSSNVENRSNDSPHMDTTAVTSRETTQLPQPACSLFAYLCREDGTYRADPVIIYGETEDCSTGAAAESPIFEPQEAISAGPYSEVFRAQEPEGNMPEPCPNRTRSSPQDNRPAKTSELKTLREEEYTEPAATRIKAACESEGQTSPDRTISVAFKSLTVTVQGFVSQSPVKGQRSPVCPGDGQSAGQQLTAHPGALNRPKNYPTPRAKDQDDEIRRSPSKTCHPRVLPRESSSPNRSMDGSLLKAFPINIDPQATGGEENEVKLTPLPRQKQSPSKEAKHTELPETRPGRDTDTERQGKGAGLCPLDWSDSSTSLQCKSSSQKTTGFLLARSHVPQDYEHYLGPQGKAFVPALPGEEAAAAETEPGRRPPNFLRESGGSQRDGLAGENAPPGVGQHEGVNSSQDMTTRVWSRFQQVSSSFNNFNETDDPNGSALKPSGSMSSSKSVEDLASPTASPPVQSEQMKSSVSVPVLQQRESDSDATSETTLGVRRRNTGSSMSNISLSSGMASMSSVSGSTGSIDPADFREVEVQGSIQFAMNYIQKLAEFHIFVVLCRGLSVADPKKSRSDPYVKCYLLPDQTKLGKRKTAVKKKTLNPTYNEVLRFQVMMDVLKTQTLNISVWHNDTFGRNRFLGEVDVDLSEWDFSNAQINEYALKARVSAQAPSSPSRLAGGRGQMRVALRFLPQTSHAHGTSRTETGEVQIWVKDCKNLPAVRGVIIDPFVKCTILPDASRKSRQKTRVVKRTANPMFNHTMVYDGFRPEDLREACVEITVWDHDRLQNRYVGGLRLGPGTGRSYGAEALWMDSTADEAHLWQRMLRSDGEWVEEVLPLRMLLMAKSMAK